MPFWYLSLRMGRERKVLFSPWPSPKHEDREGPKDCSQRWAEAEAARSASGC